MNNIFWILLVTILTCYSCDEHNSYAADQDIEIIRDEWGVPHIYAPTDKQVAYGLAWAQCEDDFITLQEQMAAIKGVLGEIKGKDGLVADFAIKFMGIRQIAAEQYSTLDPKVQRIVSSFVAGANAYAAQNPKRILDNDLFPIEPSDVVAGFMLGLVEISGAGKDLERIMNGRINEYLVSNFPKGSNAIAISRKKSSDNETYLAINSHQPLEGWYSWYEAHLVSDEGMNILGGTFPGGAVIFHGTNEHLGWAHTVNHADFSDVYKLEMNPDNDLQYKYDGEWLTLAKQSHWSWMKLLGPINIPIRQTNYTSVYGSTFETDEGYFAWKFVAQDAVKAIEQWYRMNRANSFDDFYAALEMQGIPSTNIVYADKDNNIFFISNGKLPVRDASYQWDEVLPGNTSQTNWSKYHRITELPQVLNPDCGYVYNTNNTPYSSSCQSSNPAEETNNSTMGYLNTALENNRSNRLQELILANDSLDYTKFKEIKFDRQYPQQLTHPQITNLEDIFHLDEQSMPDIAQSITVLKKWNRRTDLNNEQALLFLMIYQALGEYLKQHKVDRGTVVDQQVFYDAIANAQSKLMNKFGMLEMPLGDVQKHIRGDVSLPLAGGPDVLAAIYSKEDEQGNYKGFAGESYIQLVRFTADGDVKIESINAYGSSANPDSEHYTDQMTMFANQQLKPMSLERDWVLANAAKSYHPMRAMK